MNYVIDVLLVLFIFGLAAFCAWEGWQELRVARRGEHSVVKEQRFRRMFEHKHSTWDPVAIVKEFGDPKKRKK